jgi:UDP-N-acetylmuramoyl-tripeptide--D-alanyl-D-alanine ligase
MELGTESIQEHQALVDLMQQYHWNNVVLVGGDFEQVAHPYLFFLDAEAAAIWLKQANIQDGYFLIKGSRSMKMERTLNVL